MVVSAGVPIITFLLLTGVGLHLAPADFAAVRRQPGIVAVGVLAPLAALPLIALALTRALGTPPGLATGLLLVAVSPVGGISNTYTHLARASTALSVALTGLSCLLAGVAIPLVSRVLEALLHRPLGFDAPPGVLLLQLMVMLGLPVALGMVVRQRWRAFADARQPLFQRAAFAALGLLIAFVIASDPGTFVRGLAGVVPLSAGFGALSFAAGWLAAAATRSDRRVRFTLGAVFGTRNIAVATAIAVTLLRRPEFAVFAVTYFLTQVPLMVAAIALFRAAGGGKAVTSAPAGAPR